jgi:hypothetical protein
MSKKKAEIVLCITQDDASAAVSKALLAQLDAIRAKSQEMSGALNQLSTAQQKVVDDTQKRIDLEGKLLSGAGNLATTSAAVVANIAKLVGGTSTQLKEALEKVSTLAEIFKGAMEAIKTSQELLHALKEYRGLPGGSGAPKGGKEGAQGAAIQGVKTEAGAVEKVIDASADKAINTMFSGLASKLKGVGTSAATKIESLVGSLGSTLKGVATTAATRVETLLTGMSPNLGKAAEQAAKKLGSLVSSMGSKLQTAAGALGSKFESLKGPLSSALGSITGFFAGAGALAAGLAAVIAGAVAYIGVKLDEMFNNGRVLRTIKGWGKQVGHFFGTDLPTGELLPEDQRKAQEAAERKLAPVVKHNEVQKEVRGAQREYFAARGLGKDFNKHDLSQANDEIDKAESDWERIENRNDSTNLPMLREGRLAAYDHFKEAQEHILETTRETTKELESQLSTQRQQVTQAEKLVEQENARFQGRKADFGRLPKDIQQQIATIGNKLGTGKDLSDAEAELSDKYGFFKAATTKHYASKVTDDQARALQRGGESGIEAAVKAVADAKANEKKIQEALETSVRREQELTARILKARIEIAKIKSENLGEKLKVNTELPNLGTGAEAPKPPGHGQNTGHQQVAAHLAGELLAAMTKHLVPAIHETMRRTAAQITNAGSLT